MASSGLVMTMTKALGACCLMPLPTELMILALMPTRSSRRHAGLARHARGDDHDVGALDVLVVGGAAVLGVEALDRAQLGDVERLALGDAFEVGNVEQDDVAQFLLAGEQREGATNLSGADQRDLLASHAKNSRFPKGGAW